MKNWMKKLLISGLLLLCICLAVTMVWMFREEARLDTLQAEMLEELEAREGEYDAQKIVLRDTSKSKAKLLAEKLNGKLRITSDGRFATLTLPDGVTIKDIFADDRNRELLDQLSPDYMAKVSEIEETEDYVRPAVMPNYTVSDTYYSAQSYLGYLNIGDAWNNGYMGAGRTVAIIDTGIDTDHPEFAGRISEYSYNATEDKIVKDYDNDWSLIEDEQGHGTAVAGVIAAAMDGSGTVGISPNVTIIVIKAECDEKGNFNTSDLVFGLYYAIERDVDVINMSFGTPERLVWDAPVRLAEDSDILMVAAAGNDATASFTYPAAHEKVLGVGALEAEGWALADYSNYGENVDLVAPGTVYTTQLNGGYGTMDGTSFSAPMVTAALILMKGDMPYADNATITEILYASCYDLGDLGHDWYFGYGALDIHALLCEERGTVTFNMLTDELENTTQVFVRSHTLQNMPEPERLYAVFDGWYYDIECTEEYNWYSDIFYTDLTLYANWVNEDDGIPYTYVILDDGTVEIRSYTGRRRYITIPDRIEGREVSSIGDEAFKGQTGLQQINLPENLKTIKREAFSGCSGLVSMQIPDTVVSIGENAFYDNVRLSSVSFGKDSCLREIGDFAFGNCGSLRTIDFPARLESMTGSALYGATSMIRINIASGNANFVSADGVLFNKTKSMLVAFPAGITTAYALPEITRSIGEYAFGYTRLSQIDLMYVTSIGKMSFASSRLESIVIPDTVVVMDEKAFSNSTLSTVVLGDGLTEISEGAFDRCIYLSSVEIPGNIREIEADAFAGAVSLREVTFAADGSLASIGEGAFYNCPIETLNFPDSLMYIDEMAFCHTNTNPYLKSVTWGESSMLQRIESQAFRTTVALNTITFPENLQGIGSFAFLGSGLAGMVEIPVSVTNLGAGAFASCHSLSGIEVAEGNGAYVDYDGVVYSFGGETLVIYPAGKALTSYTVREGVRIIGEAAFYGSWNLKTVGLCEGIVAFEDYAFYDCESVASYSLPESLEQIGAYALSYNSSLEYLFIPDNVIQVGAYAFSGDSKLARIDIRDTSKMTRIGFAAFAYTGIQTFRVPSNVSTIAQYAFEGCEDLTSVAFAANSKLESIFAYFFKGCGSIQSIVFESGSALKSIQAHGFEGMKNLRYIDFGDAKLENIDNYAFRYCSSLMSFRVPDTLTNIGRFAFYKCTSLSSLSVPETLEHIGAYAFHGTAECNLYFAGEGLPLYLDENWDNDLGGYYTGVLEVKTEGDWQYARQTNGKISIIEYLGEDKNIDLTKLSFGEIESIGGYAFYAKNIESITMPDTVKQIQRYAFAENRTLKSVQIPASTEYIARNAFYNTGIESLVFAGNCVKVIEQYAFAQTRQLQGVVLPSSLETIGSYAFYHSGMENLVFPKDSVMTEIPQAAFAGTNLVSVTIPDSVTLINHNAFRECHALKSVTFGGGKDLRIMSNAFYDTGLETVYIPENVEYIGEYAFVGLKGLTAFAVSENNEIYAEIDGVLYNKAGTKIIAFPAGRAGSFVVPKNVETIGFGAFENSVLSAVAFEDGINLLSIGYRAFFGAENLTRIDIPASVVSIDYYAFARCANLTTVNFAEDSKLTGIYEGAFYGCDKLCDIVVPDSVAEISDYAFYGCMSLTTLPLSETNMIKGIYSYAMAYTGLRGELTLPETLIDIGDYAFRGTALTKVTVPADNAGDLVIGIGAFADCRGLEEISVPFIGASYEDVDITWFGYIFGAGNYQANATYVPESLKKVSIAEGISFVGTGAFYGLTELEEMDIPASVSVLYPYSFRDTKASYTLKNEVSTSKNRHIPLIEYLSL